MKRNCKNRKQFINLEKEIAGDEEKENQTPVVLPYELNKMQRFAFDTITEKQTAKEHLLIIIN